MIKVNPDNEFATCIRNKIKQNGGYCPCSLVKSKDTKCMCKEFRDMIERGETGYCHCGLYMAEKDGVNENSLQI